MIADRTARRPGGLLRAAPATVGIAILLALLLARPVNADGSAADSADDTAVDDRPHITMAGTASAVVVPDLAVLRLGVVSEAADAAVAVRNGAAKLDAVIEAARAQGVAAGDIVPDGMNLAQIDRAGGAPSFRATHTIRLRSHDPTRAAALVEVLVAKGVNRIDGVSYTLADPENVLAKLTGTAVANARRRAESAAGAAGVRLGQVLQIERPDPSPGPEATPRDLAGPVTTTVEVTFAIEP